MSATSFTAIDCQKLVQIVEPIARAHGAEVVDVELKTDRSGWVLRVTVEKLGAAAEKLSTEKAAIDLERCSDISKDLGPALDVADLIPASYNLEVGTPGLERALRGEEDYVRFAGEKAKLKLRSPAAGQSVVVGVLQGVVEGKVTLQEGSRSYEIPLADVASGHLVFEWPRGNTNKNGSSARGPAKQHLSNARAKRENENERKK